MLAMLLPPIIQQSLERRAVELLGGEVPAFGNLRSALGQPSLGELEIALISAFTDQVAVFVTVADIGFAIPEVDAPALSS